MTELEKEMLVLLMELNNERLVGANMCYRITEVINKAFTPGANYQKSLPDPSLEEIKERFFKECTDDFDGIKKVNLLPRDIFKWFAPFIKGDAVEFQDWIFKSPYSPVYSESLNKTAWVNTDEHDILMNGSDYHFTALVQNFSISTKQLYELFKEATISSNIKQ